MLHKSYCRLLDHSSNVFHIRIGGAKKIIFCLGLVIYYNYSESSVVICELKQKLLLWYYLQPIFYYIIKITNRLSI